MQGTYDMMKKILNGNEGEYDDITLVREYKNKLLPNILAHFYCVNFRMISELSSKHGLLDDSDKASICLQVLDFCLQNYNETSGTKFTTFFMSCFRNKLIEYEHRLFLNANKVNLVSVSLECCDDIECENNGLNNVYAEDILNECGLTILDKQYCKLMCDGYSIKEISNYFGVSLSKVYKDVEKIKKKFLKNRTKFA